MLLKLRSFIIPQAKLSRVFLFAALATALVYAHDFNGGNGVGPGALRRKLHLRN
jgi:hypothetical protein